MKFIKAEDFFYKSYSNEIPIDSNVTNFAYADRHRAYGGAAGDDFYGTVSRKYPISIVPEFAVHNGSLTDWAKDSVISASSSSPAITFRASGNTLFADVQSFQTASGLFHGPAGGLDDATFGTVAGTTLTYNEFDLVARVSSTGAPDQVELSVDGGTTYATATNITASALPFSVNSLAVVFGATTGHTLNSRWHCKFQGQSIEVITLPTTIQDFDVIDADPTMIAVRDAEHLYIFPLDLDTRDAPNDLETVYNSFNISRFTRVSLEDVPLTNYKVFSDSGTLKVVFETANIHEGYTSNQDIHFKITPTESNMDLNSMRHGGNKGYIYLDNNLETHTATEMNVKIDSRYRTSGEGKKYAWIQVRDERGVPMASQTVSTQFYLSGTAISYAGISGQITIDGTGQEKDTDAYGIVEFELEYQVNEQTLGWIEVEFITGPLKEKVFLSRDYSLAEVS